MSKQKKTFNKWKNALSGVKEYVQNRIAYIQQVSPSGYVYYGESDDLPNKIIEYINNSGTATSALGRKRQFVLAEGFIDETTNSFKVNSTQTFYDLLDDLIDNHLKLGGFALRFFYNSNGRIKKIENVPLTWIRIKNDQEFIVNPLMGEYQRNRSQDVVLKKFDISEDEKSRAQRIKSEISKNKSLQYGEIYYCFKSKLGRNYNVYPVPSFYSAIDDIISDGKISNLELRNIVQGWRTPIVISTGSIDNLNEDEDGYTQLDYFNENIESFLGEDAAPVLHLMGRTDEEKPVVTTIDMKEIVDMTEKATIRIGEKVCRLLEVPPVLVGFAKQGQLGNVQELENTMKIFNLSIINIQDFITNKLNMIKNIIEGGESLNFKLSKLDVFDFLPDQVMALLDEDEIRERYNIPIKKTVKKVSDQQIAPSFSEDQTKKYLEIQKDGNYNA